MISDILICPPVYKLLTKYYLSTPHTLLLIAKFSTNFDLGDKHFDLYLGRRKRKTEIPVTYS